METAILFSKAFTWALWDARVAIRTWLKDTGIEIVELRSIRQTENTPKSMSSNLKQARPDANDFTKKTDSTSRTQNGVFLQRGQVPLGVRADITSL